MQRDAAAEAPGGTLKQENQINAPHCAAAADNSNNNTYEAPAIVWEESLEVKQIAVSTARIPGQSLQCSVL